MFDRILNTSVVSGLLSKWYNKYLRFSSVWSFKLRENYPYPEFFWSAYPRNWIAIILKNWIYQTLCRLNLVMWWVVQFRAICTTLKALTAPMEECYFYQSCKLQPATLQKVTIFHRCLLNFSNFTNGTKSRKASFINKYNSNLYIDKEEFFIMNNHEWAKYGEV